jgi:peroxiredoxin
MIVLKEPTVSFSCTINLFLLLGCLSVSPAASAESKLIGTTAKEWQLTDWINSKPLSVKALRGKVILVRWWTGDGCPFCAATAPALREFHAQYAAKGLIVIGVYHHKTRGPLKTEKVRQYVKEFGFHFPVATDPGWRTLKSWWLNGPNRKWTSVSFLIDRKGVVRHIHPGGSYRKGDQAYWAIRDKIQKLVQEN